MDDRLRHSLHERLDAILDERARAEEEQPPPKFGGLLGALSGVQAIDPKFKREAADVLSQVIALGREAIGDWVLQAAVRRTYVHDSEQRQILKEWLWVVYPLIQPRPPGFLAGEGEKHFTLFHVLDALEALDAGEVQPIVRPNSGKNRRANRWSLAVAKLEALIWKQRLKALNYEEKAANYEITVAFGEQWDTIRKWQKQCVAILGGPRVYATLDWAAGPQDRYVHQGPGIFGKMRPDVAKGLKVSGEEYRAELRRSAELSKRKRKGADA